MANGLSNDKLGKAGVKDNCIDAFLNVSDVALVEESFSLQNIYFAVR